jgi:hypothetical protein
VPRSAAPHDSNTTQELWLDFIADTGDGGNPTYAVARALAAPHLRVPVGTGHSGSGSGAAAVTTAAKQQPEQQAVGATANSSGAGILAGARSSSACNAGRLELPRGEVLLIGGDLAYPNPCRETFEQRLFVPFQEAMPPPPHYHPGRLVVHKPDLPPTCAQLQPAADGGSSHSNPASAAGGGGSSGSGLSRLGGLHSGGGSAMPVPVGLSPRASRFASASVLRDYPGPNAFAIPGNRAFLMLLAASLLLCCCCCVTQHVPQPCVHTPRQ